MNERMRHTGWMFLTAALIAAFGTVGCTSGGGGGRPRPNTNVNDNAGNSNDNANDNTSPPLAGEFATGAVLDADRFENLPQAINPFAAASNQQLPSSADITADFPPIGDQGRQSSCVAFAAGYNGATYGANRQFQWGANSEDHQASPGYLYAKLVDADADRGTACGTGTLIATAMNLLVQGGCSSFATVGYSDQSCFDPTEGDASNFRIGSFKRVEPGDRTGVKAELAAGNAVVMGCELYEDFMQFTGPGVYEGNGVFLQDGAQHAAHAMAVVGYDDSRGAYRIRNSWGTAWGDDGSMWMAYETFEATTSEVYSLLPSGDREPPDVDPGPDPEPGPQNDPQAFLDDAFQFAIQDPFTGLFTVYLVFYWHFDQPVFIHTITITAPDGSQGQQPYETWYSDGYVAFFRSDGLQWFSGAYGIEFNVTAQNGNDLTYTDLADVAALDDGGGGTGQACADFCEYAFDGECDDGGPGAQFDVCEFGTDCGDCGPRDENGGDGDGGDFDIICADVCEFAFDDECDDGGPDSDFAECAFGTDCFDCGPREAKAVRTIHRFRGREVKSPTQAKTLPAAGVSEGTMGENGKALRILSSENH